MFYHSSSFTANPIACAGAVANLRIWREEPVLDRIAALHAGQARRMDALAGRSCLSAIRHCGTILAFDVEAGGDAGYLSGIGPRLAAAFRDADVLLRPLGNTIYMMPPYCISENDLDTVFAAIGQALDLTGA